LTNGGRRKKRNARSSTIKEKHTLVARSFSMIIFIFSLGKVFAIRWDK